MQTKTSPTIPKLLARYCDEIVKNSARTADSSGLEESLNRAMVVYNYLYEKDAFHEHFTKALAGRPVSELWMSEDEKTTMIAKLKAVYVFGYTSKLQRIFLDMEGSRDSKASFQQYLIDKKADNFD